MANNYFDYLTNLSVILCFLIGQITLGGGGGRSNLQS